MKLAIVCRGNRHFLEPLEKHWRQKYTVVEDLQLADVVYVEWANEQCIRVSREVNKRKVVVRVLGSEYYQWFWARCNRETIYSFITENPECDLSPFDSVHIPEPINTDFWIPTGDAAKNTIVHVGTLDHNKGQLNLLRILAERSREFDEVLFVGNSQPRDPEGAVNARKILTQVIYLAKDLHLLNVRFVGQLPPDRLRELYNSARVVVSVSQNEGCQTSVQEALSCGHSTVLVQNWMGSRQLYPSECIFTTSSEFWRVIDLPQLRNRQWALDHFSYPVVLPKLDAELESAASCL